ncbi:C40 family peptidase [Kitasatospora purpeofusca]|uniref:C40 family peptidase n=1 Tax=Kitasatospora purpeofusca TaxID=67352 RepID=UPI0035D9464C
MSKFLKMAGTALFTGGVFLVALMLAVAGTIGKASAQPGRETGPGGGITTTAPVPEWLRSLIATALVGKCPQLTPSLLAAQLFQESGFDPKAESLAHARGIAQFMDGTWSSYGVDGNGDGRKDPLDPADAVPAAAAFDCALAEELKGVAGDSTENMLAGYNAGPGAVKKYNGIPPYPETRNYVRLIRERAAQWAASGDGSIPLPQGSEGAGRAIAAARTALDTPYVWGGDCISPYAGQNGCDCSSLVKMAWGAAGVNLPRTTYDQINSGTAVLSIADLSPGDLLFSRGTAKRPEHVGMYIGEGQVIEAPKTGLNVRIRTLDDWRDEVLAMRHIA